MGTCTYISKDRTKVVVEYPSEPPLAEAAAQLMQSEVSFNIVLLDLVNVITKVLLRELFSLYVTLAHHTL